MQHAVEPLRQELRRRDAVRDAGVADLALGADQPLGERRLGHEERPRDLGRGQAAQRPQRQGDPGVHRQRRVAAGEDQAQPVVGDGHRRPPLDPRRSRAELGLDRGVARRAPRSSRRARLRRRSRSIARLRAVVVIHAPGLSGTPRTRPGLEGRDERVLDGLLGEVEVAEDADQRRDRPSLFLAEQAVDERRARAARRHGDRRRRARRSVGGRAWRRPRPRRPRPSPNSKTGRTSIEPRWRPGIIAAIVDRLVEVGRLDEVVAAERSPSSPRTARRS